MNLSFFIAGRYLFSHKRSHVINLISAVAVIGVAIATTALVCTMSVFNGFQDLVSSLFTAFDPELRVTPVEGPSIAADDPAVTAIKASPLVEAATECVEGQALARYYDAQSVVVLKGVDDNFTRTSGILDILYGDGSFRLKADVLDFGTPGAQVAQNLGLGVRYATPLDIYAPRKGETLNPLNPSENFNHGQLYSPGVIFAVQQKKYDARYIICPISFARQVFEQQGCITSLDLKLRDGVSVSTARRALTKLGGGKLRVQDRYEQQDDVFRIMKIEKFVAYLFLSFIMIIACFNIVGSLSMLIIEKRDDMATLRSLGADNATISSIFYKVGVLIAVIGVLIGIGAGALLCLLQQHFGLIKMGSEQGEFIVDAYPVSLRVTDLIVTFFTVIIAGNIATWYPVKYLSRRLVK